jgi:hypothetical protein
MSRLDVGSGCANSAPPALRSFDRDGVSHGFANLGDALMNPQRALPAGWRPVSVAKVPAGPDIDGAGGRIHGFCRSALPMRHAKQYNIGPH